MRHNDLIIATTLINDALAFGKGKVFLATDSGIYFSSDYGENFDYSHSTISATKIYKFEIAEKEILAGTDNGVFVLNGENWETISLSGEDVYSLKYFKGYLFCGTENSIFILRNGKVENEFKNIGRVQSFAVFNGKLFAGTSKGLFEVEFSNINPVFPEPVLSVASSLNLYVGLHSGIAYTENLKTFRKVPLEGEIIRAVLSISQGNEDFIFAGSDSGLWVSKDSGRNFPEKRLRNVHIFSLSISENQGEVLVGSWGRGLIKYKFQST